MPNNPLEGLHYYIFSLTMYESDFFLTASPTVCCQTFEFLTNCWQKMIVYLLIFLKYDVHTVKYRNLIYRISLIFLKWIYMCSHYPNQGTILPLSQKFSYVPLKSFTSSFRWHLSDFYYPRLFLPIFLTLWGGII